MLFHATAKMFQSQSSILRIMLLAIAYFSLGRLSLLLAIPPGYAMAIYPPAGLAVAAVLIGGYRLAPGIAVGSFLLNLWITWESQQTLSQVAWFLAGAIALGAMLQVLMGSWLIKKILASSFGTESSQRNSEVHVIGWPTCLPHQCQRGNCDTGCGWYYADECRVRKLDYMVGWGLFGRVGNDASHLCLICRTSSAVAWSSLLGYVATVDNSGADGHDVCDCQKLRTRSASAGIQASAAEYFSCISGTFASAC